MNVLLSIKPRYVQKIISRVKRYEFRKAIFKEDYTHSKIYIYSSSPVQKIIGYFSIEDILEAHPDELWDKCKNASGIPETDFFNYFQNRTKGYAIKISNLTLFHEPIDPKSVIQNFVAPQSYRYIGDISGNYCSIS